MKIRTALFCAASAAFIASTGLAYAAYTGQFNIVQWAGVVLGAPTAAGTSATGNILPVQGVTGGVPIPVSITGGSGGAGGSTPQTTASNAINISTATTTVVVTHTTGDFTYITGWDVIAGGTGNFTLEYGTGSNCGTGTTALTGAYNLTAQNGEAKNASGASFVVPVSNDVCAVTSAAVQYSGSIQYTQSATVVPSFGGGAASNVTQATASVPWSASSSTTTQLVAASGTTTIYVTSFDGITDGSASTNGTFQVVQGTGTNCGTSQTALSPAWNFQAGNGIQKGSIGPIWVAIAGNAICLKTTTANLVEGSVAWAQF